MTVHRPAYLRSILAGVAAWLVSIVLLHWLQLPIPIEAQFSRSMAALAVGDSAFFGDFFPTVNSAASGMFAALLLLTSAVILGTGWVAGLLGGAA
jgi:hypothetical protein